MNAERLLAHYDGIADAPDAIPRLRRFILDLAVRGKLVPQNSTDEPVSELLKRIEEAKAEVGIKQNELPLGVDETPFELPIRWAWRRVGEICSKTGSGSTPRGGKEVYKSTGIPFLRSQNVYNDGVRLRDVAYIDTETHLRMSGTRVLPGDLLLNITGGSIGRCCRVPENFNEANISQHVAIIRPALKSIAHFLHWIILSPYFQAFIIDEQTGAGRGGLPKNRMDRIAVPLPPEAEQHRIAARVGELMALCDRLEAARAEREKTRDRLTTATLTRLNAPDPESFHDDARFALNALPALTARPDQIKQLRQTVLNLAVCGKLVPQDLNEEPASELLKQIGEKRVEKMRKGEFRASPKKAETTKTELPVHLPRSWELVTISEIAYLRSGIALERDEEQSIGELPYLKVADMSLAENSNGITTSTRFVGLNRQNAIITSGSIVFPKRGGAIATNRKRVSHVDIVCDSNLMAMTPFLPQIRPYLELWFNTLDLWVLNSGTSVPQINNKDIYPLELPLPPLREQHRIISRVDELMAVCDRLEASLGNREDTRRRLLDALLAKALESDQGDLEQAA